MFGRISKQNGQRQFFYTESLSQICQMKEYDPYSLHHEFSQSFTRKDLNVVEQLEAYIEERGNPFDISSTAVKNLSSGENTEPPILPRSLLCSTVFVCVPVCLFLSHSVPISITNTQAHTVL